MSKGLFYTLLMVSIAMVCSCQKHTLPNINKLSKDSVYVEGFTRVIGIGKSGSDTSSTPFMQARVETILAMDEDSRLKAELIGFKNLGGGLAIYTLRVINKTTCQNHLRWSWEQGLTIDSIAANTLTPTSDVIHAKDTIVYTIWGDAKTGAITVKSQAVGNCGSSKILRINITTTILPIKYTVYRTHREDDKMIVEFSTEEPQGVDFFQVLWSADGNTLNETCKTMIISDGIRKSYTISFPAVKKAIK